MSNNDQLSGLDLLFGALGATLFLYILIMSMAGVPKKQGVPVPRVYRWEFEMTDKDPVDIQLFWMDEDPQIAPKCTLAELKCEMGTSEPVPVMTIGKVTTTREEITGKSPRNILVVEFELGLSDDNWMDCLELRLNSTKWETVDFNITPGTDPALKLTNTHKAPVARFFSHSKLKEIEDGYMPEIKEFKEL